MSVDELAERAFTIADGGERHILGLTGAPGAGKSTVAGAIVDSLGARRAALVGMERLSRLSWNLRWRSPA
jgi:putative protein kinase ArgK-like GTPase of G3E family